VPLLARGALGGGGVVTALWLFLGGVALKFVLVVRQARRERRERIRAVRLAEGPGAALRFAAGLATWNDRRLRRVSAQLERLEGPEAADRLRQEIREARERTGVASRPVHPLVALAAMVPLVVVIAAATAWALGG
jgi:hypothetical protein